MINNAKMYNKKLAQTILDKPVIFTFHMNWKVFENFGLEPYSHIKAQFKANNINVELLPIFTDKRSDFDTRIKQVKTGIEKIVDKYGTKAHLVSYSLSGLDARGYISQYNGDQNVSSLLTIATPNR